MGQVPHQLEAHRRKKLSDPFAKKQQTGCTTSHTKNSSPEDFVQTQEPGNWNRAGTVAYGFYIFLWSLERFPVKSG